MPTLTPTVRPPPGRPPRRPAIWRDADVYDARRTVGLGAAKRNHSSPLLVQLHRDEPATAEHHLRHRDAAQERRVDKRTRRQAQHNSEKAVTLVGTASEPAAYADPTCRRCSARARHVFERRTDET